MAESDRANLSAETGVPLGELDRIVTAADVGHFDHSWRS